MRAWIETLLENLVTRVWLMLAGKVAAQVEVEVAATRAQLLEQAAAIRRDHPEHGEKIACRLETVSEQMAAGDVGVTAELAETPSKPSLRIKGAEASSEGGARRPRGRPKKEIQPRDTGESVSPRHAESETPVEAAP